MKIVIEPEDHVDALRRWRGGVAKLWLYHISRRTLALRIQSPAETEVLYIVGNRCDHINGPFVWDNANISVDDDLVSEAGEHFCRVSDVAAGFELRCSAAALSRGPANELDRSFEDFLGDYPTENRSRVDDG